MDGQFYADLAWQKIQDYELRRPRSRQKHIGPSELGDPCARELAFKAAGMATGDPFTPSWAAIVGTAIHAMMEKALAADPDWVTEKSLDIGGITRGTSDAFHLPTGCVVDWKCSGKAVISKARRRGPADKYRSQINLYGLGWEDAGYDVKKVCLVFLPRTSGIEDRYGWAAPYDRTIAQKTIDRYLGIVQTGIDRDLVNHPERLCEFEVNPEGCYYCTHPQGLSDPNNPERDLLDPKTRQGILDN